MKIYFNRLQSGFPSKPTYPPDWDGCWKVYTVCETSNSKSCTTRSDARAMAKSALDLANAQTSWGSLLKKAHTGQSFSDLYDEKKCHPTLTFKYKTFDTKIWRIWGTGDIRMYFIYLEDKRIMLLKTWAKRKDKLSEGEEGQLKKIATNVLECIDANSFKALEL